MDDERKIKIAGLWDTIKRYDAYISTVNFKSGLITSLNLAIFGGVILKSSELIIQNSNVKISISIVLFLISLLSVLSVVWVVRSISPRLSGSGKLDAKSSFIFFNSVASHNDSESYSEFFKKYDINDFENDLINQVYQVALITDAKFKLIKFAGLLTILNLMFLVILSAIILLNGIGATLCLH